MNNPGRYLTLLPPIDGANAISGSPYYTENPGDRAQWHDGTVNPSLHAGAVHYLPP